MSQEVEAAVVFADVVGSTQLYDRLGDTRAREMVGRCVDIMRTATEAHHGTVIKTMGDEVMATFPRADSAINAARQMQECISLEADLQHDGDPVAIRIGCHFGPIMREQHDVFGSTVNIANRMTSQAKARQIVTTLAMIERLSPEWQSVTRQIDVAMVRGKADEVALYEVLWQPEEATGMLPTLPWTDRASKPQRLSLRYQGRELIVGGKGPQSVTLGRADENDLVVKGQLISRLHARVEAGRDRFTLFDESTNGTFVQTSTGEDLFVRRDSTLLSGHGVIGLGRNVQPGSELAIHYVVED